MYRTLKALILVALFLVVAMPVQARQIASEGAANASGLYDISIDDNHMVTINAGLERKYEAVTTSDTLTVQESGKVFLMLPAAGSPAKMTLPSCTTDALGVNYTFIEDETEGAHAYASAENGPQTARFFFIDPDAEDYIVYQNSQAALFTMDPGDCIYNQGVTGDSITLICAELDYWHAHDVRGTWTDGGTN